MLTGCGFLDVIDKNNQASSSSVKSLESKLITVYQDADFQEVASVVEPAIVGISGVFDGGESVGSGVCVAEGGYVLTNSHVVNGARQIYLHLSNKTSATASVIYNNPVLDLAILKTTASIPYLPLGNSDNLAVGEDVLAVGTPLSLSLTHTFTKGIVSALNRTLKVGGSSGEGYMQNLIQHDASLNPGNSGGPLLNSKGEVIGINTLKITSGEGIGFAIPTKSFGSLLNSYVENINYTIPYLGVYGYDSEIANYYDNSIISEGFYVLDVAGSSPLVSCGIERSCVITSLNGKKIKNTLDLKDELYSLDAKDTIYIEYVKDGVMYKTKTKLIKSNI